MIVLCVLVFASFPAFIVSAVHAIRGNKNRVPVWISIFILVDEIIYAGYIYEFT